MIGVFLGSLQSKSGWLVYFYCNRFQCSFSPPPPPPPLFFGLLINSLHFGLWIQRDDFWNEAIKLADLHHPNVLAFYGVVLDGPGGSVATVTEYMVNGSLRNALQKNEK